MFFIFKNNEKLHCAYIVDFIFVKFGIFCCHGKNPELSTVVVVFGLPHEVATLTLTRLTERPRYNKNSKKNLDIRSNLTCFSSWLLCYDSNIRSNSDSVITKYRITSHCKF